MAQNLTRDRDKTESLVYFSRETKTRLTLSPINDPGILFPLYCRVFLYFIINIAIVVCRML